MNLSNPFTEEYFELKQMVLSSDMPWFFHDTTVQHDKYNFPFYSHVVQERCKTPDDNPVVKSPHLYELSVKVVNQILEFNNYKCFKIYRINFNATQSNPTTSSPHVDHFFSHKVMLVYFSKNCGGETLIFAEEYPKYFNQYDKITLKHVVSPVEDSIIEFNGLNYHCHSSPSVGNRRVVMVVTYECT